MAGLKLEHIYKVYPNGTKAVSDFSMEIKDGEFIVFVGPSGCGKSTTLRMIAGLEEISAGELYIDNKIVNDVTPKDRDIAMVFQNYALYPHMTVYENMAFGLRLRHLPNEEIHKKVLWAANVLDLNDYLDRKPNAMSGGQRQRVSLGRAILRNPKVMLLDEPLSNLDAKLRAQMRSEIAKLHKELKTTFIYVTHDQVEAMTLGTRVVVMKKGVIQQVDTPKNLYDYPENKFVAGFIGTPQMNFFECTLEKVGEKVSVAFEKSNTKLVLPYNDLLKVNPNYLDGKHKVYLGLRCENVSLDKSIVEKSNSLVDVKISHFEELGNETLVYGDINMEGDGFQESNTRIIIKAASREGLEVDSVVKVHFDISKAHFFDYETEQSILPRLPKENVISAKISSNVASLLSTSIKLPEVFAHVQGESDLIVPVDAIKLNGSMINSKISRVEKIENKYLLYLDVNGRVIFGIDDKEHAVGEDMPIDIDLTQISFLINHEPVIEKLAEFDALDGKFVNLKTAQYKVQNSEFDVEIAGKADEVRNSYKAAKEAKEAEFNAKIASINENRAQYDADAKKVQDEYNALVASSNENFAVYKADYKAKISEAKAAFKAKTKSIKEEVYKLYADKKALEAKEYEEFLKENKDKDAIAQKKQEHSLFKQNFKKDRDNDIDRLLATEQLKHDGLVGDIKGNFKRNKNEIKYTLKGKKEELKAAVDPIGTATKAHKAEMAKLIKEENEAINRVGLVFFMRIGDDYYDLLNETISNKLIQGLGTSVFSKNFIIEIPHDAFSFVDSSVQNALKGTITATVDYGSKKFYTVEIANMNAKVNVLTPDFNQNIGDEVTLTIDITKTRITEKGMNIRLY